MSDEFVEPTIEALCDGGRTGEVGDGKIFVLELAAPAYAFGATFVLLKLIGLVSPLRASAREEALGMDVVSHGEEAYATSEGAILVEPDGVLPEPVPPRVPELVRSGSGVP